MAPHEKSFSTGDLASHIVECLGWSESIFNADEYDFDMANYRPYQAKTKDELLKTFEKKVAKAKEALNNVRESSLDDPWQLKMNGQQFFEKPRADVFRDFVLSHSIREFETQA